MELSAAHRKALLDVARQTIRAKLGRRSAESPIADDPMLHQPAGCFVTLRTLANHHLRGCVGQLDTSDELINVVRRSAANALDDPRFLTFPVSLQELPELDIEITVIFPLRPAADPLDFDLLNEGIYLIIDNRSGCFLPQVAQETGWNKEQLLSRLCSEKLGLSPDAWRNPQAKLMKFSTMMIGPEPFET